LQRVQKRRLPGHLRSLSFHAPSVPRKKPRRREKKEPVMKVLGQWTKRGRKAAVNFSKAIANISGWSP